MTTLPASSGLEYIVARGTRMTEVIATSGTLAFKANQQQLLALFWKRSIQCIISRKGVLDRVVLLVGVRQARDIAGARRSSLPPDRLPTAEDNKTSVKEGRSYKHVAHRCSAYDENMPPINALSV